MLYVDEETMAIILTRGDSAEFDLGVTVEGTGEPYDFSHDLVQFTVKVDPDSKNIVLQKTFEGISVKLEPDDTKDLPCQRYVYDVRLLTPQHDVYTPIDKCTFTLTKEVNSDVGRA